MVAQSASPGSLMISHMAMAGESLYRVVISMTWGRYLSRKPLSYHSCVLPLPSPLGAPSKSPQPLRPSPSESISFMSYFSARRTR